MAKDQPNREIGDSTSSNEGIFDVYGRSVPNQSHLQANPKSRRYFTFSQPDIDYRSILARTQKHLNFECNITIDEFETRADKILSELENDPVTRNITDGVCVPFFLPNEPGSDIGHTLENRYLPAVDSAFVETFPNYEFVNHSATQLAGRLSVVKESRHDRLMKQMQREVTVGYFFPCLTEYSIPAAIAQTQVLPEQFLLAGGFDICSVFIGCPDLLSGVNGYPPLIWMSGLRDKQHKNCYHFEAYGHNLTFNRRPHLDKTAEYWSSGLTILG